MGIACDMLKKLTIRLQTERLIRLMDMESLMLMSESDYIMANSMVFYMRVRKENGQRQF